MDFLGVIVIQIQGLPEGKQMLGPIVALQGFGNLFFIAVTAWMTMLGQLDRIVLTRHNVADDLQPGFTGDVADDVGQLHIHQMQGLLHALDVGGPILDQVVPMTGV